MNATMRNDAGCLDEDTVTRLATDVVITNREMLGGLDAYPIKNAGIERLGDGDAVRCYIGGGSRTVACDVALGDVHIGATSRCPTDTSDRSSAKDAGDSVL